MEEQQISPNTPLPITVGDQLRAAREAQGLSLSDIAAQTRVAERHLISIEENRFSALAAPTYAVGFARSYARAVGMDEVDIAARVRRLINAQAHTRPGPTLPSFEPGDPARVPPSRIAWLAGLLAVVVVGVLLFYWTGFLSPEGKLPDLLPDASQTAGPAAASATVPQPAAPPPPVQGGTVVLTALAPKVWIKVTDAAGSQILQKELALGESWTVPADAQGPQLRTGRPDMLQIALNGTILPPLSSKPVLISGVALTPAGLTARLQPAGAPAASASPLASASPVAQAVPRAGAAVASSSRADVPPAPRMDDLLRGLEGPASPPRAPGAGAARDPLSTTEQ